MCSDRRCGCLQISCGRIACAALARAWPGATLGCNAASAEVAHRKGGVSSGSPAPNSTGVHCSA